jgi:hypothetical protein
MDGEWIFVDYGMKRTEYFPNLVPQNGDISGEVEWLLPRIIYPIYMNPPRVCISVWVTTVVG